MHEHNYVYIGQQIIAPGLSRVAYRCECGDYQSQTMAPEDAKKLSPEWQKQEDQRDQSQP